MKVTTIDRIFVNNFTGLTVEHLSIKSQVSYDVNKGINQVTIKSESTLKKCEAAC